MPVPQAKNNIFKINDLQSQCRMPKNKLGYFLHAFFVHNRALEALPKDALSIIF